jgi:hypothetical protein
LASIIQQQQTRNTIVIKKLTKEQEAAMPVYRARFIGIGHSTVPGDHRLAEEAIDEIYTQEGLTPPKEKVWVGSPYAGAKLAAYLEKIKEGHPRDPDNPPTLSKQDIYNQLNRCGYGQHDVSWIAFYQFFYHECGIEKGGKTTPFVKLAENAGWWWPYQYLVIITEKMQELHLNERGRLHKDRAPALVYPDGFSIYALNGVVFAPSVTGEITDPWARKEWVLCRGEELEPELVMREKNVEIRRELLRKIGVERFVQKCGAKTLDRDAPRGYELLQISLPQFPDMVWLKMQHPSLGTWHMEGVAGDCRTVQQALNWRAGDLLKKGEEWRPDALT